MAARQAPRRHRLDQAPRRGPRLDEEGVEAEGHRPRAPGQPQAPHWVGGGSVFGPKPRNYEYKMPRKAKKPALRSALSLRASGEEAHRRRQLRSTDGKTKSVASALTALGVAASRRSKALIVDAQGQREPRPRRAATSRRRSGSRPRASTSTTSSATRRSCITPAAVEPIDDRARSGAGVNSHA